MAYTGTIYRGVDYSPTWPSWSQGPANTQTNDSDFANDAFASLWGQAYQAAPNGDPSVPGIPPPNPPGPANSIYRNDLQTIVSDGFNLVRLYDWDMARGTTSSSNTGLDHINFLNYANTLGLKIVVPVSDYFLSNDQFSWGSALPDSAYTFDSAPEAIQTDFTRFINSITVNGKISTAIHSIAVGNEGDIHTGLEGATASQFLARTNWWIYNLNKTINGTPGFNNGTTVKLTATISNADQGTGDGTGTWFNDLLAGVSTTTQTPNGWTPQPPPPAQQNPILNFDADVTGLSVADPGYASYYYNSVNIAQVSGTSPYSAAQLSQTLGLYDNQAAPWPYPTTTKFDVPLLLMEVFNNNRSAFSPTTDQATAYVNQAKAIEAYLAANSGTTNLMGYNFFEFNDEPSSGNPQMGLYQYTTTFQNVHTGTTSVAYLTFPFPDLTFPVYTLTPTPGPTASPETTLVSQWTAQFPATHQGTASVDKLVGSEAADRLRGAAGGDSIDGGNGYDIALFDQNARGYTLKATAGSATITVQDKVGAEGTDTLTGVEQIRFADGRIDPAWIIKTAGLAPSQLLKVVDLYTAGLNRAPDALGLDYYASRLADGASISAISKAIFSSPEAAPIYSQANSNSAFLALAYQTAVGHAPDAAGQTYWLNALNTGQIARTDFVTALIAGAQGADMQYIANKEAVGAHFALTEGLNNLTWATAVESAVNGTADSVTTANAQTDAFATIAATPATSELVVQIVGVVP